MNIEEIVNTYFKNKNGKLEAQRLNEKWIIEHCGNDIAEYFVKNNLLNSENLYNHLYNPNKFCQCGVNKRFKGFRDGYTNQCPKCSKISAVHMKSQGTLELELKDVTEYVKDVNGHYSSTKIKRLSKSVINKIIERTSYLNECKLAERLYHIEHNLYERSKCKLCGEEHQNFKFITGYFDYCKHKCSYKYNIKDRSNAQRKMFYSRYVEKYKSNSEYNIQIFSLDDYLNKKDCIIKYEHLKCGNQYDVNINYQGHLKCPKCYPIRSKKQYEVFEFLKDYKECKMNDRQLIKPQEIDILTENFGIEYDSLMFHSTGKSSLNMFNNSLENKNYHVNKTNSCEEKGIQLLRIFSTEWINKQDIWKSILLSKLGKTNKIFARKCSIKEISSEVSKKFLNDNHLQGGINSSIRLGLFYSDELVSVMIFGRTRRSKWAGENNFELLRFCSVLNHTVIGAGSKLLKYFERKYNPRLIVSYANRRWSTGNLYNKLGFEFVQNTVPNYFYFKGADGATLLSREQFQKHMLSKKLSIFDPNLTETENMYNNGYRKIYDAGNKVYIKKYKI